jgi:hypothetical protein
MSHILPHFCYELGLAADRSIALIGSEPLLKENHGAIDKDIDACAHN